MESPAKDANPSAILLEEAICKLLMSGLGVSLTGPGLEISVEDGLYSIKSLKGKNTLASYSSPSMAAQFLALYLAGQPKKVGE